jgi:hypothetical protein
MVSYKQSPRFGLHGFPLVENRDEWGLVGCDAHKDQQQLIDLIANTP